METPTRASSPTSPGPSDDQRAFDALIKQWRAETGAYSLAAKKQSHPLYLRIIGLGPAAIPSLLREIQRGHRHLFAALEAITGENPAPHAATFTEAATAWLKWGDKT